MGLEGRRPPPLPKFVIPTGGTAHLAVPERRNPSLALEFRFRQPFPTAQTWQHAVILSDA